MEKLNLNFSGGDNVVKSICWIMSYLSWLLLVETGWASIKWLDDDTTQHILNFYAVRTLAKHDPLKYNYYPL
jgi:hypothetical protein